MYRILVSIIVLFFIISINVNFLSRTEIASSSPSPGAVPVGTIIPINTAVYRYATQPTVIWNGKAGRLTRRFGSATTAAACEQEGGETSIRLDLHDAGGTAAAATADIVP
jgi:hypothetical protein